MGALARASLGASYSGDGLEKEPKRPGIFAFKLGARTVVLAPDGEPSVRIDVKLNLAGLCVPLDLEASVPARHNERRNGRTSRLDDPVR